VWGICELTLIFYAAWQSQMLELVQLTSWLSTRYYSRYASYISLYFLEIVLDYFLQWGFVHCTTSHPLHCGRLQCSHYSQCRSTHFSLYASTKVLKGPEYRIYMLDTLVQLNTASTTDTTFNSTILPSSPRKPDIWTALLGRSLRLNFTLTISTGRVAFVSVNHASPLSAP
jgi:hypothetical protein